MNRQKVGESETTCCMELVELMDETCLKLVEKLNLLEKENQKLANLLKVQGVFEGKGKLDS